MKLTAKPVQTTQKEQSLVAIDGDRSRVIADVEALPDIENVLSAIGGSVQCSNDDRVGFVVGQNKQGFVILYADEPRYVRTAERYHRHLLRQNKTICLFSLADYQVISHVYEVASWENNTAPALNKTNDNVERGEFNILVDDIIAKAAEKKASDIHLQTDSELNHCLIKERVDGELYLQRKLPFEYGESFVNALFWGADKDSKSGSLDQQKETDMRLTRIVKVNGIRTKVTLRIVYLPMDGGHDIVMRLIYNNTKVLTLSQLGYNLDEQKTLKNLIHAPHGLLVLTGPTGSGKSTTLQTLASLYIEAHKGRHLLRSMEDPVEYKIPGARQKSVRRTKGSGEVDADAFTRTLNGMMRGDPDAILIGEIRDKKSARIAMQAAQTGHLVLTTLHTNNAVDTVERLIDLGMDRHILASPSMLLCAVSQRLAKKVCPDCSSSYQTVKNDLSLDFKRRLTSVIDDIDELSTVRIRGDGQIDGHECETCNGRGVLGRTVVSEFFIPDRKALGYIAKRDTLNLSSYWRMGGESKSQIHTLNGYSLMDRGIELVRSGTSCPFTIESLLSQFGQDESREAARSYYEETK